jgi:Protein of unknown function (DUF2795)
LGTAGRVRQILWGCNQTQEERDADGPGQSRRQHYLRGTDFPAEKEEVASNAESNGATQDLVAQIRGADTERFDSPEEVMQAVRSGLDLG